MSFSFRSSLEEISTEIRVELIRKTAPLPSSGNSSLHSQPTISALIVIEESFDKMKINIKKIYLISRGATQE